MARPGTANRQELAKWADSIGASSEFPRLIRRLVLETGKALTELSFPAAEGSRLGDWDGIVRAGEATPFIPDGLSGWELSVEKAVTKKADSDYAKRTTSPDGKLTSDCTYVAASLRVWKGRKEWTADRTKDGRWKAVRALGLDEIDTWIEDAPVTQAWFSEQNGLAPHGLKTIEGWWINWSTQTRVVLPAALMLAGRERAADELRAKLAGSPQTISINANSRDEILAFIAGFAYAEEAAGRAEVLARTALVDEVTTWRSLVLRSRPLVLVAASDAVIGETGGRQTTHHVIVPVTRSSSADIDLPPIDSAAAAKVLTGPLSEKDASDVARLARISLLAARRRLAAKRELLRPTWAEPPVARVVRRLLLANRWSSAHESDKDVVARLAGQLYAEIAEDVIKYSTGVDPLLTTVDAAVNVVSPYDAYLLLVTELTTEDLTQFKTVVLEVLGTANPALELAPDQRWQASVLGKSRPHSSDLRAGLANSLALLGSLGEKPVQGSTMTPADYATWIVRELLQQANKAKDISLWASLDDVLPEIAEAAPAAFLDAVAESLKGQPPLLKAIFVDDKAAGIFTHSTHTGLLWALEICAWSPDHFGRAIDLLAGLAEVDPGSTRHANRPFNSLREILLPWHPQNSVDVKRRLDAVDGLRKRHPAVAWRLMLKLFPESMGGALPTHPPSYRQWKPPEKPVLMRDYWGFVAGLVERVLEDVGNDSARWVEVTPNLDDLPTDLRKRFLDKLEALAADTSIGEEERAQTWEALDELVGRHREFPDADWVLPSTEIDALAAAAERFKPTAPQIRHRYLFDDQMPSLEGMRRRDNWEKYSAEVARQRAAAMAEIAAKSTWEELLGFARQVKFPDAAGIGLSEAGIGKHEAEMLKLLDLERGAELAFGHGYVANQIRQKPERADELLADARLTPRQRARILLSIWDLERELASLAKEKPEVVEAYWRDFRRVPRMDAKQLSIVVKGLRSVGRVGAALDLLAMCLPKEDDREIAELAADSLQHFLDKGGADPEVNPADYDFVRLFEYMDRLLPAERIAGFEWSYLTALQHSDRSFALHRIMAEQPDFFVELIIKVFREHDEEAEARGEEEKERPEATETERKIAQNAYRLLDSWKAMPGLDKDGQVDPEKLRAWVTRARAELARLKRRGIGDDQIGKVLAHSPRDANGGWPAAPVRDLIEELKNPELEAGFRVEVFNMRGPTSRALDSGGTQEREIAARHRADAERLRDRWPRTAAVLQALGDSYERDARREDEDAERWRKGLEGPGSGPVQAVPEKPKTEGILHFAYGSNMSTARLEKRTGKVVQKGAAKLEGHEIRFDKKSDDRISGRTNIAVAAGSAVWGVLYELTSEQFNKLVGIEKGYRVEEVTVDAGGTQSIARTFIAEESTPGLRPTRKYLNYLLAGAREHGLPQRYLEMLEAIEVADAPSKGSKPRGG